MLADGIIFFSDLWSPNERKYKESQFLGNSNQPLSSGGLAAKLVWLGSSLLASVRDHKRVRILVLQLVELKTHNTVPPKRRLNDPSEDNLPLTWPGREFDQKGTTPSVEQGHCTLIAVKRYRDPPRIGGRHNFLLRPYGPH